MKKVLSSIAICFLVGCSVENNEQRKRIQAEYEQQKQTIKELALPPATIVGTIKSNLTDVFPVNRIIDAEQGVVCYTLDTKNISCVQMNQGVKQ